MRLAITFAAPFLFALWAACAQAGNVTVNFEFTAGLPTMQSTPTCSDPESDEQPFLDLGTFTVNQSGDYDFIDASEQITFGWRGLFFGADYTFRGGSDNAIHIYDGRFLPGNPAVDLHFDTDGTWIIEDMGNTNTVELEAGTEYRLVVQNWCYAFEGVGAVIIRGPGEIESEDFDMFENPGRWRGNFSNVDDVTDFGGFTGIHKYTTTEVTVPETGTWFFFALGPYFEGSQVFMRFYSDFDPDNPDDNQVGGFSQEVGAVYLEKGKKYTMVSIDIADFDAAYQIVRFAPGHLPFNPGLKGTWFNPATAGQGALIDYSEELAFMFLALFTFQAPEATLTSNTQAVGSTDQRWLTGYSLVDPDDDNFPVKFENSMGGSFNSPEPPVMTDSEYGTGHLTVLDCDNITLSYELPDGLSGEFEFTKTLPGDRNDWCYQYRQAGEARP